MQLDTRILRASDDQIQLCKEAEDSPRHQQSPETRTMENIIKVAMDTRHADSNAPYQQKPYSSSNHSDQVWSWCQGNHWVPDKYSFFNNNLSEDINSDFDIDMSEDINLDFYIDGLEEINLDLYINGLEDTNLDLGNHSDQGNYSNFRK
jgi:hypothetical protein